MPGNRLFCKEKKQRRILVGYEGGRTSPSQSLGGW